MQVMDTTDLDLNSVLVGQVGETVGFGVTDDPMLMSMLSTSLYENPLRTMIQEIMFNAWDAHLAAGKENLPIEISINDSTGLSIKDYGSGIAPEDMHDIYCVYGHSTKRQESKLTGGFGLGSKSPFAYSDSFMVSSAYKGLKSIYVAKRSSEENNGGPGLSTIVNQIETDDSGLTVSVSLKNNDAITAYRYVHALLEHSGIFASVKLNDNDVEHISSTTVKPGEYLNLNSNNSPHSDLKNYNQVIALYGGVKYVINTDEYYQEEYENISKISDILGPFLISFHADTLTPLPNREGLNLSDKTKEVIKIRLEQIIDNFNDMIDPAIDIAIDFAIKNLKSLEVEPQFILELYLSKAPNISMYQLSCTEAHVDEIFNEHPDDSPVWISLIKTVLWNTKAVADIVGTHTLYKKFTKTFLKYFPEWKRHGNKIYNQLSYKPNYWHDKSYILNDFNQETFRRFIEMKNDISELTGQKISLRVSHINNHFANLTSFRGAGKVPSVYKADSISRIEELRKNKHDFTPDVESLDSLWYSRNGDELHKLMQRNTIVIGKTVTSLNDTDFKKKQVFSTMSTENKLNSYTFPHVANNTMQYAFYIVVNDRKDSYNKAIKYLKTKGMRVIEADPSYDQPKEKKPKIDPERDLVLNPVVKDTFPVINTNFKDWFDPNAELIDDPEIYICLTRTDLKDTYNRNIPSFGLINNVMGYAPKTVILHHKGRERLVRKSGAISIDEFAKKILKQIKDDEENFKELLLYRRTIFNSGFDKRYTRFPQFRDFFYLKEYTDEEVAKMEKLMLLIRTITNDRSKATTSETVLGFNNYIKEVEDKHEEFSLVSDRLDKMNFISVYKLNKMAKDLPDDNLETLIDSIINIVNLS